MVQSVANDSRDWPYIRATMLPSFFNNTVLIYSKHSGEYDHDIDLLSSGSGLSHSINMYINEICNIHLLACLQTVVE